MSTRVTMRPANKNTMLKVVILGDGGVGKSCLMNRFVSNHFDDHSFHTIGVEFLNKDIEIDGETYTLQIWDTAGQERFKTLRTPFYRGSDICLLTYAIDDKVSFRNLSMWKNEFLYYADVKENLQFPFIVVGNKFGGWSVEGEALQEEASHLRSESVDVMLSESNYWNKINAYIKSDITNEQREVSLIELEAWCNENNVSSFIETSAKNSNNVQEAFKMAVQYWLRAESRADRSEYNTCDDTIDLRKKNNDSRTSCCSGSSEE